MNPDTPTDFYAQTAALYDHVGPYVSRNDVAFFVDAARISGGPVLELGAGTGRVLIPTAREGIAITGLDSSHAMLDMCRRRLANESAAVRDRVTLVHGDMRAFDLGDSFALVTLPFRPFQHLLRVEDQIACLHAIRRHLRHDGALILDVFNPILGKLDNDAALSEFEPEAPVPLPGGATLTRSARVARRDLARQILLIEMRYDIAHPDGRTDRIEESVSLRYFFRYELEHLLARCGLRVESVYSDYIRNPFGVTYPGEILIVARPD